MAGTKHQAQTSDWGIGCAIPSTSQRATTRQPGARATRRTHRFHRGLPPGCRAVGLCQIDGIPHDPNAQDLSVTSAATSTCLLIG